VPREVSIRSERNCQPGIWEGRWWRNEASGIENKWDTSAGFRIGLIKLSITRKITLIISFGDEGDLRCDD